ncbi:putative sensor domain DACNV-containing protein [Pontibacter locisalis]|uniref:Sensor domain DACNV-containing protein n=1 Tax=Pontibacter locisalis TaxID=1719035 RepID=A0ABW5IGR8_9BACT
MGKHRNITYQAAKTVSQALEEHFKRNISAARHNNDDIPASSPPATIIEAIIDTAFWTSLRREEGQSPKISLAWLSPDQADQAMLFEKPLPLNSGVLTKLGPGVERPGIHLGVWQDEEDLYIWGATRSIPSFCFVVDVPEPGLLVIKHRRLDGFGKFANVAVLKGDEVKVVDEDNAKLPDSPNVLKNMLGYTSSGLWDDSLNVLVQMAVSMRAHKHGGSLLVVPSGSTTWQKSIIYPINFAVQPAFSLLKDILDRDTTEKNQNLWQDELKRTIDGIAGLTAIDGATIISDSYELLAFGAKIGRREGMEPVNEMLATEPIAGSVATVSHPARHGGTRHLSAAQFVHDQREAMALIASQDGRFTVFSWSRSENMVQAHRIETLLL